MASSISSITQITASNSSIGCPIRSLPLGPLMEVLSFLELKDVPAIELVCKTFKAISNQACLWRKRLKTVFPNISPQVIMSIKDQMKIHYIAYKNAITKFNQKEAELKTQVQAILGPNGSDGLRSKAFKLYSICEKQVSKKNPSLDLSQVAEAFYNQAKEVFEPTSIVGYYADPNSCVGVNKDPEYFLIRARQMNEDLVTLIGNEDPCALSDNSVSNDSVLGKVIQQKQACEQKFQTQEQFNSLISTHQQS